MNVRHSRATGAVAPGVPALDQSKAAFQARSHPVRDRFLRHRLAMIGLILLALLVLAAIFAPLITGQSPEALSLRDRSLAPSRAHILGTDAIGRDIWSRLVYGARVSLSVAAVAVAISLVIGVTLGSLAGLLGGWVDEVIMRLTDIVMCFPIILLLVSVTAILPPSIINVMVIIGVFGWTGMCRLVRGQILSLREAEYVVAARANGAGQGRIILRHLLPNAMGPLLVAATLAVGSAILAEASLSFLGLGVQDPTPSWGSMIQNAAQLPVLQHQPWRWIPPALAISLAVLSINFIGDGLRDAFDPRTKKSR